MPWGGPKHKGTGFRHHSLAGGPNYQFGVAPQYDGEGAAKFVYEMFTSLPVYSFRGNARLAGTLNVFQNPQIYYTQAVPVAGIGGLVAGQIFGQTLVEQEPVV